MRQIIDYSLVDHGIEASQYFQGCGVAFTEYEDVATGIGDNPAEAIDDALEQLSCSGWDTEGMEERIMRDEELTELPTEPSVSDECDIDPEDVSEMWYYVSIRVK